MRALIVLASFAAACGPVGTNEASGGAAGHASGGTGGGMAGAGGAGGQTGCGGLPSCYTVYAHGDHVLYRIDLESRQLVIVGPFRAPQVTGQEDVITDLAVSPEDVIYGVSNTHLYTVSAADGHVTSVGPLGACGTQAVALTFTMTGGLYAADFMGAFCRIDLSVSPPRVDPVGRLGQGLALAGDLVATGDGTMFGTAYRLSDAVGQGTQSDNLLVKVDPATGQVTQQMGQTGFPKLFGVAYDQGRVFGFTHDGTGRVITIDPVTGRGTLYATFLDSMTGMGISFAGAAVNARVPIGIRADDLQ